MHKENITKNTTVAIKNTRVWWLQLRDLPISRISDQDYIAAEEIILHLPMNCKAKVYRLNELEA